MNKNIKSTRFRQDKKAYYLLEHPEKYPGLIERHESDRKLLLYRYPSFKPSASWSLFENKNIYWIRRIEWNSPKWFPSHHINPCTMGSESTFSSKLAKNVLSSFCSIEFSTLKQSENIGIDGTVYGINSKNWELSFSLQWWCLPSDEWKPLADWFDNTVNIFEQFLPESTCRNR